MSPVADSPRVAVPFIRSVRSPMQHSGPRGASSVLNLKFEDVPAQERKLARRGGRFKRLSASLERGRRLCMMGAVRRRRPAIVRERAS